MKFYNDVHLKEKLIDTVIVHVEVNDLRDENSQLKINQLIENIKKLPQNVSVSERRKYMFQDWCSQQG